MFPKSDEANGSAALSLGKESASGAALLVGVVLGVGGTASGKYVAIFLNGEEIRLCLISRKIGKVYWSAMSTANFHEPSLCRLSTSNPFKFKLTGGASGESLYWA